MSFRTQRPEPRLHFRPRPPPSTTPSVEAEELQGTALINVGARPGRRLPYPTIRISYRAILPSRIVSSMRRSRS